MALVDEHCQTRQGAACRLDPAQIAELLPDIPGWQLEHGQLQRHLRCADFSAALALALRIGELAEEQNHHPDLSLGWGRLAISYSTHDVGGLSRNDFICAARINALLAAPSSSESPT